MNEIVRQNLHEKTMTRNCSTTTINQRQRSKIVTSSSGTLDPILRRNILAGQLDLHIAGIKRRLIDGDSQWIIGPTTSISFVIDLANGRIIVGGSRSSPPCFVVSVVTEYYLDV